MTPFPCPTPSLSRRAFLQTAITAALVAVALAGTGPTPARAWSVGDGPRYRTLFQQKSEYNGNVRVVDDDFSRYLMFDRSIQTGQDKKHPNRSVPRYIDGFHLGMAAVPNARRALFIGLGGGMGPRQFHAFYPKMQIDAVEIDPLVVKLSKEYFGLPQDSRMRVFTGDGRAFLEKSKDRYDLIFLDAYDAHSAPPLLTTVEFMRIIRDHLTPQGALVANVIAALDGSRSRFGRSEYKTFRSVFSEADVFPIQSALEAQSSSDYQNLMIVSLRSGRLPSPETWRKRVRALRRPEILALTRIAAFGPHRDWPTGDVDVLTDARPPREELFGE